MRLVALSTAIVLAACGSAFAQAGNNGENQNQSNPAQNQSNPAHSASGPSALSDQVKSDLQQAGFSDVQVVPRSFLVRAKDKDGQPVMMLIHENSIMTIAGYPDQGAGTTGSGANSGPDSSQMPQTSGQGAGKSDSPN